MGQKLGLASLTQRVWLGNRPVPPCSPFLHGFGEALAPGVSPAPGKAHGEWIQTAAYDNVW